MVMMSKAHTFPPKHLVSFTHTHTHTHTHKPLEEREQEKQDLETLLKMSIDELHMGGAPLAYKGLSCLVVWSLSPSNLCP